MLIALKGSQFYLYYLNLFHGGQTALRDKTNTVQNDVWMFFRIVIQTIIRQTDIGQPDSMFPDNNTIERIDCV